MNLGELLTVEPLIGLFEGMHAAEPVPHHDRGARPASPIR
jgi:hypothetical protein